MNFESLKLQFLSYLSDKLTKEGKTDEANDVLKNPTSLVRYFSAFKEYLSKESSGSVDLKTISISDLDKLEYKNGKYTIREEDEDDGFEEYSSSNPTDDNSDATKNLLNGITEGLENAANGLVEGAADADAQPKAVTIDTILSDDNIAADSFSAADMNRNIPVLTVGSNDQKQFSGKQSSAVIFIAVRIG